MTRQPELDAQFAKAAPEKPALSFQRKKTQTGVEMASVAVVIEWGEQIISSPPQTQTNNTMANGSNNRHSTMGAGNYRESSYASPANVQQRQQQQRWRNSVTTTAARVPASAAATGSQYLTSEQSTTIDRGSVAMSRNESDRNPRFSSYPSGAPAIHPSRCPPIDLQFLWKLYHQRQHIDTLNNRNHDPNSQHEERIQILQSQGFPVGLASLLLQHTHEFPIRIWLIDNSGTMHHNDGHIVTQNSDGKVVLVDCSRWQEVSSTVRWHAELAAWVQTPMAIRFLRDPGAHVGPQQLGVSASKHHSSNEEVSRLKAMLHKIRPTGGTTPIHYHLQELIGPIQSLLPSLYDSNRRLVICVCTDSIPTDANGIENPEMIQDFILTLQQFTEWPVQVVIRLLTDEERVVHFYQHLSTTTNTRLQVLDDYVSECRQVQEHNPWLHYGYPLHLCREQGIHMDVLETLSKRALTATELIEISRIIFAGQFQPQDQLPFVHFRKQIEEWNKEAGVLWNPMKKRFVPWVDLKKLDKCYKKHYQGATGHHHGSNGKCTIM